MLIMRTSCHRHLTHCRRGKRASGHSERQRPCRARRYQNVRPTVRPIAQPGIMTHSSRCHRSLHVAETPLQSSTRHAPRIRSACCSVPEHAFKRSSQQGRVESTARMHWLSTQNERVLPVISCDRSSAKETVLRGRLPQSKGLQWMMISFFLIFFSLSTDRCRGPRPQCWRVRTWVQGWRPQLPEWLPMLLARAEAGCGCLQWPCGS
mmetsp:Transcript_4624/g.13290  ORF Transcript_4624/g.13290 Transcript_4624/m.13290 type:complete len:207 (-) Transcript_4624:2567-3187(-)